MAKPATFDGLKKYRIDRPEDFRLLDHDTGDTGGLDKETGRKIAENNLARLIDLSEKLYAQNRWSLLLIFQGMDAAGKDSAIAHVMSGVNPQGCSVHSFKVPSEEELDHDFLWRTTKALPERGRIGIFNRSYYEEVLIVRVHPEVLARERIPPRLVTRRIWAERFHDIANLESYLARNGIVTLKFFLNLSREAQRKRFLDRLDEPAKRWKFSVGDAEERKLWPRYMAAYQEAIRNTSTPHAPWYVVPADHKWFSRVVIGSAIVDQLDRLGLAFPKPGKDPDGEIRKVREALLAETGRAKKPKT